MLFDFAKTPPEQRYKLLVGLVTPRPIALVSTRGRDGVVNAAPFSFFNVFSEDPAVLALGIDGREDGSPKDTARNIRETGCFVVNLVDEAIAAAMNICATELPPHVSELPYAGLTAAPCAVIDQPRLAEAPVSLECRLMQIVVLPGGRDLMLGTIVALHARDGILDDRLNVDPQRYKSVGRLYGPWYARLGDRFRLDRKPAEEVMKG
ncbi:MAG: flavin reductase family protein [Alphaproteobacteria bacterium]|nr:flavin reductase family protein [Alphaproteobacteria bacterium]